MSTAQQRDYIEAASQAVHDLRRLCAKRTATYQAHRAYIGFKNTPIMPPLVPVDAVLEILARNGL